MSVFSTLRFSILINRCSTDGLGSVAQMFSLEITPDLRSSTLTGMLCGLYSRRRLSTNSFVEMCTCRIDLTEL